MWPGVTYRRHGSFLFFWTAGLRLAIFSFFPICFPFSFRFDFLFSFETALYAGATGDGVISGASDDDISYFLGVIDMNFLYLD